MTKKTEKCDGLWRDWQFGIYQLLPIWRRDYLPKVSFFWDPSQEMSSSGFPPKKTGLYLVDQIGQPIRGLFFVAKLLEIMSWLWSQKKLTLGIISIFFEHFGFLMKWVSSFKNTAWLWMYKNQTFKPQLPSVNIG